MCEEKVLLNHMLTVDTGKRIDGIRYRPVYNYNLSGVDIQESFKVCLSVSRNLWTYLGYSGLLDPWHDDLSPMVQFNQQETAFLALLKYLGEEDIDLESYCVLTLMISDYSKWERPALLFHNRQHRVWMRKFRIHARSRSRVKDVSRFILRFLELQIEHHGMCNVSMSNIIGEDSVSGLKVLSTYHRIADRMNQFESKGVAWSDWLEIKFKKCLAVLKPKEMVYLKAVVNKNNMDPDLGAVKAKTDDPWREVREFLGLSDECQFPDGFIPKGWVPANDDFKEAKKIAIIRGDGFYFYANKEQRRGKQHYAANTYWGIKCTPENFKQFKTEWRQPHLFTARPTWAEYRDWAIVPGKWDENGKPDKPFGKPVKWRKR